MYRALLTGALCIASVAIVANQEPSNGTVVNGYEVPTIADSNYAIPSGALFVAPNGNDANIGTLTAPKKTLHNAVAAAASGATIVMRAGTYRESIGMVTKRLSIQPYPHEQVWFDGSVIATGFARSGTAWKRHWTSTMCATCFLSAGIDPAYPAAGSPEQVFIDGSPVHEVLTASGLTPTSFWLDRTSATLWLGGDPSGHIVNVVQQEYFANFATPAAGSSLRGIGIERFGAHYNTDIPAMVIASGSNIQFDRDTFAWSSTRGIAVFATSPSLTNNLFVNNGMNGVLANAADNLMFSGNRVSASNIEHFSIAAASTAVVAAVKITSTRGATVKNNTFADNYATGLWLDISSTLIKVVHNTSTRNSSHGFAIELGADVIVADNVSAHNGRDGIRISGSNRVEVWGNTVLDNGYAQIGVYEDPRVNTNAATVALGATWNTASVRVANNVAIAGPTSTRPAFYSFDLNAPAQRTTFTMVSADDHNLWGRTSSTVTKYAASLQRTLTTKGTYTAFAAWQAGSGRETLSRFADNTALTTIFVNPNAKLYTLAATAPKVAATTLPANVAAALGTTTAKIGAVAAPVA